MLVRFLAGAAIIGWHEVIRVWGPRGSRAVFAPFGDVHRYGSASVQDKNYRQIIAAMAADRISMFRTRDTINSNLPFQKLSYVLGGFCSRDGALAGASI